MTVTHKLFKILNGHDVANGRTDGQTDGRTDGQTDGRHTIIRPKFYFGRIKMINQCIICRETTQQTYSWPWIATEIQDTVEEPQKHLATCSITRKQVDKTKLFTFTPATFRSLKYITQGKLFS